MGDWILVRGRAWQISDVRFRHGGGRVVHLHGRPPVSLGDHDVVLLFRVVLTPHPGSTASRDLPPHP